MSPSQTQRIALVTGANRGIGLEVARQLAAKDFHVVIAARTKTAGDMLSMPSHPRAERRPICLST